MAYDPETGELRWLPRPREHFKNANAHGTWNKFADKSVGSRMTTGYLNTELDGVKYLLHRLIWKLQTGRDPIAEIDHINGNRGDNRWANLREALPSQNMTNQRIRKDSITGIKGVRLLPGGRFAAHIRINGKFTHLGVFETAREARAVHDAKAREIHGEFFNSGRRR